MNLKEIKELIEFVVKQDLNELEFEQSGFRLRITKGLPAGVGQGAVPPGATPDRHAPVPVAGVDLSSRPAAAGPEAMADAYVVKSPIVGTFYRSPGPDAEPFVKVGDFVEKGSVLCIIEAMKLMNEIESEVAGEIVEIYVESGHPVEYGESLFAVRVRL